MLQNRFLNQGLLTTFLVFVLFGFGACSGSEESREQLTLTPVLEKLRNRSENQVLVCAHRAYHKEAPENSLAALSLSLDLGVDIVELDIRTTKDDSLILMHDATVDRTTNGTGHVRELNYAQIQELQLMFKDSVTNEHIPTLTEVLRFAKGKNIILNLDLKAADYQQLYAKLSSMQMEHQVISFIGSEEGVDAMKSIDPSYGILPLAKTRAEVILYNEKLFSPLIHLVDESYNQEILDITKENRQLTFINSLKAIDKAFASGNTAPIEQMIRLRPAIIQTDHPKMLITLLREKNLHE